MIIIYLGIFTNAVVIYMKRFLILILFLALAVPGVVGVAATVRLQQQRNYATVAWEASRVVNPRVVGFIRANEHDLGSREWTDRLVSAAGSAGFHSEMLIDPEDDSPIVIIGVARGTVRREFPHLTDGQVLRVIHDTSWAYRAKTGWHQFRYFERKILDEWEGM